MEDDMAARARQLLTSPWTMLAMATAAAAMVTALMLRLMS
jgi:hypothetical protein